MLADDYDQATQPDEVADYEPNVEQHPAPVTHVIVVRPARASHGERHHSEHHPLHRFINRLLSFRPEDW